MFKPIASALDNLSAQLKQCSSPKDSFRVFHGRGHSFAGLDFITLDWFDPLLLVTLFREPMESELAGLMAELQSHSIFLLAAQIFIQHRYQVGAPMQKIKGSELPDPIARRGSLRFILTPGDRQNVGYFLDMEPGRQWLEQRCKGRRVLNLFAFTCAFSVVAEAAGAGAVVNVDMSSQALARGRENHRLNGLPLEGISFLSENILKSWGRIRRAGPYDIIILDPPSFQKGSFVAEKDYAKLVRRLAELLPKGGEVLACLNAPEINTEFILSQFLEGCPQAQFIQRLTPSVDFPDVDPERSLKLLHFELAPTLA